MSDRDRNGRNETCENRRKNGLFAIDGGFRSSGGLDGGDHLDQTGNSPLRDRTGLRNSSQELNFLLQRPVGGMGSFA